MKTKKQLITNIIGQLEGIGRMMEEGKDCQKIITQMKAVRSAMTGVMDKYIQENISRCMSGAKDKKRKQEMEQLISELIRNK